MEDLKKEVKKILDIAKECPENFQQTCFEILLRDILESRKPTQGKSKESQSHSEDKAREALPQEKVESENGASSSQKALI